ncbi:MAG: hypothetical protein IJ664_02415 [Clostridia bacterium]|nr:hypothetical protein [Clostridia bacterium]
MRKKKQGNGEDFSFWQPASDMFSALLLILMLVILMLGLYLVHIPEHDQIDPWAGDAFVEGSEEDSDATASPSPTMFWMGDGGGSETPHPTFVGVGPSTSPTLSPSPSPTVSPTPDLPGSGGGTGGGDGGGNGEGEGPGQEPDAGMKSAVYVMLVDAETDRTIKEANVEFELYGLNDALQILNTYYPERVTYRMYQTTDAGAFYFPEKLFWGEYELHELSEPEGYDAGENVPFELSAMYDWPEPLVVRVPLYPSRNIVRVQMTDAATGLAVGGGAFDVVAAENIITADGTLRYRKGQVASEIRCDETGYGESEEIYLGNYILRQREIPDFYAGLQEEIDVQVEKKSNVLPAISQVACDRTTITARLTDELYDTRGIGGVSYRVSATRSNDVLEVTTNSSGEFVLDELKKGVTYRLRQIAPAEGYKADDTEYTVTVSADGRIGGESSATVEMTSRMIRVTVGITDEFSNIQVPNVNMALYSSANELIRTWTTSGSKMSFNGLTPGDYYIIRNGNLEMRTDIRIADQAEIQEINLNTTYTMQYVFMGSAAVLTAGIAAIAIILIRRRKKRKKLASEE